MAILKLRKRQDFLSVAKEGKHVVTKSVVLQFSPRDWLPSDTVRFGVTVSKKVGKAVVRNKAKRRIRAAWMDAVALAKPCYDYVVVARGAIVDREFSDLVGDVSYALKKVEGV